MSESTHGFLNKDVNANDVFDVIVSKFDKNAIFKIRKSDYDNTDEGRIYFKVNNVERNIFYCLSEDEEENTEYKDGDKYVALILGHFGNSVEIMTEIIKAFGGYIDENDCDDIPAYYIPKDENFKYTDLVKERNKIAKILSDNLSPSEKMKIAQEILKHKKELKELL